MNKIIKVVLSVAVVTAIAGAYYFPKVKTVVQNLGAFSGPEITSEFLKWGKGEGVRIIPVRVDFTKATTTPCVIVPSETATTTLISAAAQITTASSSATTWNLAHAAEDTFATTTSLGQHTALGNAQGVLVASTTLQTFDYEFGPGEALVLGVAGTFITGSPTGDAITGSCNALFYTTVE